MSFAGMFIIFGVAFILGGVAQRMLLPCEKKLTRNYQPITVIGLIIVLIGAFGPYVLPKLI